MYYKSKKSWDISENLVTPEEIFLNRRSFIKGSTLGVATLSSTFSGLLLNNNSYAEELKKIEFTKNTKYTVRDSNRTITKEDLATGYNNFNEISLDKNKVKEKVKSWNLKTWDVEIEGLANGDKKYEVGELIKLMGGLEERIYRFRCVEAWSMVVPWVGFPLSTLIKKLEPKNGFKYVKFHSFSDQSIGINMKMLPYYPWPYTEGLTAEEAMHPLTLVAVGMYGKSLPKQNGAPIRLVVPWKYGFKSIKSITKIEFVKERPVGLWEKIAPKDYGFYANVNPNKDHPRWSQSQERVLDGKFLPTIIQTKMFNGYEEDVAHLYKDLDLEKNY